MIQKAAQADASESIPEGYSRCSRLIFLQRVSAFRALISVVSCVTHWQPNSESSSVIMRPEKAAQAGSEMAIEQPGFGWVRCLWKR
jgi:hypothetical protein